MNTSSLAGFSVKLRSLRDYCGFSQSDLAEHMNITQPAYQKMECNASPPRLKRLQQIAEFYGIPLTDFLFKPADELIRQIKQRKVHIPLEVTNK